MSAERHRTTKTKPGFTRIGCDGCGRFGCDADTAEIGRQVLWGLGWARAGGSSRLVRDTCPECLSGVWE